MMAFDDPVGDSASVDFSRVREFFDLALGALSTFVPVADRSSAGAADSDTDKVGAVAAALDALPHPQRRGRRGIDSAHEPAAIARARIGRIDRNRERVRMHCAHRFHLGRVERRAVRSVGNLERHHIAHAAFHVIVLESRTLQRGYRPLVIRRPVPGDAPDTLVVVTTPAALLQSVPAIEEFATRELTLAVLTIFCALVLAFFYWTLGTAIGTNSLTATAPGVGNVTFTAAATGSPTRIEFVLPLTPSGAPNTMTTRSPGPTRRATPFIVTSILIFVTGLPLLARYLNFDALRMPLVAGRDGPQQHQELHVAISTGKG